MIQVEQKGHADPMEFAVTVSEHGDQRRYQVSMARADCRRLSEGACEPAECMEAVFRFLLDREPKEAILASFDVSIVSSYFPEFERELRAYLRSPGSGHARR